jgi:hypothetical protein
MTAPTEETFKPPTPTAVGIWLTLAITAASWWILKEANNDPIVVAALVTGVVSIIVGLLAAYLGAKATREATRQATKDEQDFHQNTRQCEKAEEIKGVVQAIYTELSCLWIIYRDEFMEEWENLLPDKPLKIYYPVTQDYFTIFNSNSAQIGQIPHEELRTAIVKAYLNAKGLVDAHRLNNRILDDITYMENQLAGSLSDFMTSTGLRDRLTTLRAELVNYTPQLRSSYEGARDSVENVLRLIEELGYITVAIKRDVATISDGSD